MNYYKQNKGIVSIQIESKLNHDLLRIFGIHRECIIASKCSRCQYGNTHTIIVNPGPTSNQPHIMMDPDVFIQQINSQKPSSKPSSTT